MNSTFNATRTYQNGGPVNGAVRWLRAHRNLWLGLPWLVLIAATGSYQFWLGFEYNSNDTTNIYLQLARGSAYLLLVLLALLWLPVMRNGMSVLRRARIGAWLPLDHAKAVHRWLGHLLLAASVLHGSQYLVYFNTLEAPFLDTLLGREPDLVRAMRTTMYEFVTYDESIDLVAGWIEAGAPKEQYAADIKPIMQEDCTKCHSSSSTMTYAIPEMPLTRYDDVVSLTDSGILSRQFRINMSGVLMLAVFALVWVTSLENIRRRYHHVFQHIHRLGYLLALLALLHIPSLEWLVAPLLVLAVELYLSRHRRLYRNRRARLTPVNEHIVRLEIDKSGRLLLLAGHYVQIRIPELSTKEWHDFSLTGPRHDDDKLVLKIRCLGDWTRSLQQRLDGRSESFLQVDIRGPFASPVAHAAGNRDWLLIAGGIGITPFLSLLHQLRHEPPRQRTLHLVWMLREPTLLHWIKPLVERLCAASSIHCHWHLYLTGNAQPQALAPLTELEPVRLQQGRPDWHQLVSEIAASGCKPACFICGPQTLAQEAGRACRQMGWTVRKEHF